ncbi:HD domain-containing protein [Azospirillum picis]|uniref:(P)ppGpp synthase/HD superfamily hydrolase n=1 Tax=Azospirillum picis TaxID=488438 RepID=A0ABU0MQX7_9PROT|nr:HD domain-containing protein [Azospirillum picis]MBP2302242.1 (p)ppGpp synthase/HD superfamily hydrolase [Azospirillum picis]MDQ0535821.1 (p)ppGpp synthase/HD superfamily hydrolase [Azospirillum picis]
MMQNEAWFHETLEFAKALHHGQVDKAGAPYWMHLERVARRLAGLFPDATKAQLQAALLHDAIEDAGATADDLRAAGIEEDAIAAIQLVSRNLDPDGTYLEWIGRIAATGNVTAIRVKLADNLDNSDPARVAALAAGPRMVAEKYAPARAILEQAL